MGMGNEICGLESLKKVASLSRRKDAGRMDCCGCESDETLTIHARSPESHGDTGLLRKVENRPVQALRQE